MIILAAFACAAFADTGFAPAASTEPSPAAPRPQFSEVWGYLVRGEESRLSGKEPITDIAYVGAYMGRTGRISGTVPRPLLPALAAGTPRVHLVIAETSNMALLHFALDERYGVRSRLIEDIARVAAGYDGVQVDFEGMARDDAAAFQGFLRDLRAALPAEMVLSVAVPARTSTVADPWEYSRIAAVADRVIVMAYDQHWSGSAPGPVASLEWCDAVASYARSVLPATALVMGLPLYGRAWQDRPHARALRFDAVQGLLEEMGSQPEYTAEKGPSFTYTVPVTVSVYYEDARSLAEKLALYRSRGVDAVSFWRIGQGPPEAWDTLQATGRGPARAAPPVRADGGVPPG